MEKENKMGTMPIGKLLLEMSLPIMISMFIQALYNIIDSYFVSQINENAFAAVSMAFPLQNAMIGLAVGTGVGMKALLSRSLGEKKFENANKSAENGLLLAIFHSLIFVIVGLLIPRYYFSSQTNVGQIIEYGVDYTRIITVLAFGVFFQITF